MKGLKEIIEKMSMECKKFYDETDDSQSYGAYLNYGECLSIIESHGSHVAYEECLRWRDLINTECNECTIGCVGRLQKKNVNKETFSKRYRREIWV